MDITFEMIIDKLDELNKKRREFTEEVNKQNNWYIRKVNGIY